MPSSTPLFKVLIYTLKVLKDKMISKPLTRQPPTPRKIERLKEKKERKKEKNHYFATVDLNDSHFICG